MTNDKQEKYVNIEFKKLVNCKYHKQQYKMNTFLRAQSESKHRYFPYWWTHLYSVETVMHYRDEVVDIYFVHPFDMRNDVLECWQTDIKVDLIKMLQTESIQLRQIKRLIKIKINLNFKKIKQMKKTATYLDSICDIFYITFQMW